MLTRNLFAAALVLALGACTSPTAPALRSDAVTLIVNADIVTMDPQRPTAEAMALRGDRIVAIGWEVDVRDAIGHYDRYHDLGGRTVVPGLLETHDHLFMSSASSLVADISPFTCPTLAEALDRLSRVRPGADGWIVAGGADQTMYAEREGPTREHLDPLFPDTPVIVYHGSGHAAFMNGAALAASGIDSSTPDPEGGYFEKDASGELTGYLSGQPAFLPYRPFPNASVETAVEASRQRASVGITTASEFALMNSFVLEGLSRATSDPRFATRMVAGYFSTAPDFEELAPRLPEYETALLSIPFIKTWTDGSPQGGTAHFAQGYHDASMGTGGARGTQEYFDALVLDIVERGYWPAIHANGDGAVEVALHAVAHALERADPEVAAGVRSQLIHAQLTTPEQVERMAELGVSPTFFTTHVYYWGDLHYERTVGPERAQRLSAMADAFDAGTHPSMHNDAPVTPVDPFQNMWVAVNRRSSSGRVIGPDQAITVQQALEAYTINGAYQFGVEEDAGSLEVGKLADFVVLDRNPLEIDPAELRDVRVLHTVMGGRVTYSQTPVYDRAAPLAGAR